MAKPADAPRACYDPGSRRRSAISSKLNAILMSSVATVESCTAYTGVGVRTSTRSTKRVNPERAGVLRRLEACSRAMSCSRRRLLWRLLSTKLSPLRTGFYQEPCPLPTDDQRELMSIGQVEKAASIPKKRHSIFTCRANQSEQLFSFTTRYENTCDDSAHIQPRRNKILSRNV